MITVMPRLYYSTMIKKYISIITYMEMLQGMNNKAELNAFIKHLKDFNYEILPVNERIGKTASELVENYTLSHNMQMLDALIARTAINFDKTLLSANAKHYQFIPNLSFKKFNIWQQSHTLPHRQCLFHHFYVMGTHDAHPLLHRNQPSHRTRYITMSHIMLKIGIF